MAWYCTKHFGFRSLLRVPFIRICDAVQLQVWDSVTTLKSTCLFSHSASLAIVTTSVPFPLLAVRVLLAPAWLPPRMWRRRRGAAG